MIASAEILGGWLLSSKGGAKSKGAIVEMWNGKIMKRDHLLLINRGGGL